MNFFLSLKGLFGRFASSLIGHDARIAPSSTHANLSENPLGVNRSKIQTYSKNCLFIQDMNFNNFTIKSQEAIQKAVELTRANGCQAIELKCISLRP